MKFKTVSKMYKCLNREGKRKYRLKIFARRRKGKAAERWNFPCGVCLTQKRGLMGACLECRRRRRRKAEKSPAQRARRRKNRAKTRKIRRKTDPAFREKERRLKRLRKRRRYEPRKAFYGFACWVCRGAFEAMDHVMPRCHGGSDLPANMRPICVRCNSLKGAWEATGKHTPDEIVRWARDFRELARFSCRFE
jgi:5-methylcytosine-specific restriction endonuclease McrA